MHLASNYRKLSGALVALAMITSSTGAMAASIPTAQSSSISPLVALSALASDSSRVAMCGAAAAAAAGAAAAQAAGQGCVLPVVDATAAPVPVSEALPPPPVAPPPVAPLASEGFGISPLLLGLVAVAAGVGLYFLLKKKHSSSPA
jgi:pilus assembly protein FimV